MKIKKYLEKQKLLCDGAFGTYYSSLAGEERVAEQGNFEKPDVVKQVHAAYIEAGAKLIRTNTFASNTQMLSMTVEEVKENIRAGCRLAREAVEESGKPVYIAGDIGPIPVKQNPEAEAEYEEICRTFLEEGVDILVFETFPDVETILPVIKRMKAEQDVFIIVQFCVNQYGYSNSGLSAKRLLAEADVPEIDAVGFNCGVGPGHLYSILEKCNLDRGKYITALPNASYPQIIKNRMVFLDNEEYFVEKMQEMEKLGVDILGGCCGTTPSFIRKMWETIDQNHRYPHHTIEGVKEETSAKNSAFYAGKENKKVIAVELSPPMTGDSEKMMDAANSLKNMNVDVVTFPDSPSGRTRADSILMAAKVASETGLCVMPHVCCRDKNAIAVRSQLLGAYMNGISNFLVVTGDPVPTLIRQTVKSVFNFDSVGFMKIIKDMNEDQFAENPMTYGGAIGCHRKNLDVEINRVKKKMEAGATFFFTQPVFDKEGVDRVKQIKEATGAKILCGVMPLVSRKNALFIKNEMTGIEVSAEIAERFQPDMTKEESEAVGITIVKEVMKYAEDAVDGFYFSLPFNRVYLLKAILE